MNLDKQGWFDKYIKFRRSFNPLTKNGQLAVDFHSLVPEHSLYKLVQPTGLLYGHPVKIPFADHELMAQIEVDDKMKVILTESFITHKYLANKEGISSPGDYSDLLHDSSKDIVEFYQNIYPDFNVHSKSLFGKQRSTEEVAERILQKRLKIKGGLTRNFWSSFFHNSLLFLDVFYFKHWGENKTKIKTIEDVRREKEEMRFLILKVIASAAYADKVVEKEESMLFKYFLKSAHLSSDKEKEAREFLETGITLEEITFPEFEESWLIKKYILELALLTVWSDKVVSDEEKEYLDKLCKILGFTEEELNTSMFAIESFVLENWEQVHYLRNKKDYSMVSEKFMQRASFMVNLNKERVVQEINESKELMALLAKSRKEQLTTQEKEAVRQQLLDILKLIPAFVIIALPFTFITLPLLLKILPKEAFPSAFQDK